MPKISDLGALAGFARKAGPLLWRRMSEDRARAVQPAPRKPDFSSWNDDGIHAAWIGHSTVLLRIDGFTILTDPVFSTRIGVGLGPVTIGMKRLVAPAILPENLPPPDLILLSHAHMDHFDLPSLRALEHRGTTVVTAAATSDLLRAKHYQKVHELKWNETARVASASIRAFEVRHWGARTHTDVHRGYNGYVIEVGRHRVLFGGDTAYTTSFRDLRSSKEFDLAIMPIGAYDPWIHAHCTPEQAFQMANDAGANLILPVHHQTFKLSSEPYFEPIERLLRVAGERVALQEIGGEFRSRAMQPRPV
ncbi:MAG TPA: MBL fold metallo-hydrolase [Bryobacteraceae bacterium]|nr:MBL fold metallo-hydrolase [Bryobacteraceae bacterium]